MFSSATLDLLAKLLDTVRLDASAPDFEEVALQVITARKELTAERAKLVDNTTGADNSTVTSSA